MKISLLTIAVVLTISAVVLALTEQWSIPTGAMVYQAVADGSGGCAVYYIGTNGTGNLVWLDKKGQEKYRKTMVAGGIAPIISFSKKVLVFNMFSTSILHYAVAVDSKGNETEIKIPNEIVYPASLPGIGSLQLPSDKKGFFIQSIATNSTGATLYRYSYK